MSSTVNDIFIENPYTGHPELTQLEADVLWEYAKLAQNVQQVSGGTFQSGMGILTCEQVASRTKELSKEPDELLLTRLRELEKKMGLVMTLVFDLLYYFCMFLHDTQFKASIWGVINDQS